MRSILFLRKLGLLVIGQLTLASLLAAQTEMIPLWDGEPPLAVPAQKSEGELPLDPKQHADIVRLGNVTIPSLTVYHPPEEKRNGTAILICPGGGYSILAMKHEGSQVAEWLNTLGVTAIVLKYRVPAPKGEPAYLRPLLDAQRAMALIRGRAEKWKINPEKIGALGFSAGGNLAAWLISEGNRRPEGYPKIEGEGSPRPNFGILIYPYIYPSLRTPADASTPAPAIRGEEKPGPVFLAHAHDDRLTPEHSVRFYLELKKAEVPAELHVYQQGGHGFGMLRNGVPINDWTARCAEWLKANNFLSSH